VAAFALPSPAQNSLLSGTWKLNNAKSDAGTTGVLPLPDNETDVITINGTDFKQEVTVTHAQQASHTYTRACTINGKESVLSPDDPNGQVGDRTLSKVTCTWDGKSLIFADVAKVAGTPVNDTLTFSTSDGGKTMTMKSHSELETLTVDQKRVFDKVKQ
jgi:hypothetical protein